MMLIDPRYGDLIPFDKVVKDKKTDEQRLSVLSGAYLGLLASMIEPTNIEGILKVDLNANDYYVDKDEERPLFLMFNPHEQEQIIQYQVKTEGTVDLYDLVNQTLLRRTSVNKRMLRLNQQMQ